MSQVLFDCPNCGFSRKFSRNEIPPSAKQCRCPKCKQLFPMTEALKPIGKSSKKAPSAPPPQKARAETPVNAQQDAARKAAEARDRYHELMEEALATLSANNDLEAMLLLEEAEKLHSTPKVRSYLAYCQAKVKSKFSDGVRTCTQALKEDPSNSDHYLNLGRIYLLVNKRGPALQAFRKGIKLGPNPQLMEELRKFEMRKPPVISSLPRDHMLNVKLGRFLTLLRLR